MYMYMCIVCVYIYIYIHIEREREGYSVPPRLRPVRLLRVSISEGLTQADS